LDGRRAEDFVVVVFAVGLDGEESFYADRGRDEGKETREDLGSANINGLDRTLEWRCISYKHWNSVHIHVYMLYYIIGLVGRFYVMLRDT
jgi:hypothetical protein